MGVHTEESIREDFKVSVNNIPTPMTGLIENLACLALHLVPDNQSRDHAISHMMQAAQMVTNSYILHAAGKEEK